MLSLAIIVKNEEKNLARLLDSAQGVYDELIIVDTGSTDRTVEIARKYTSNIHYFEWVNDFSKARNFAFSKCSAPWVMWLDADDILKPQDVKLIREAFIKNKDRPDICYFLVNYHYWVDPPTDKGVVKANQLRERIIRKEYANWTGRCHEHITVNWNLAYSIVGAAVWHLRDEEDRAADADRNIKLMKLEAEENPNARSFHYLGNEYSNIGKTKEAIDCYETAIKLTDHVNTRFQASYKIAQCFHGLGQYDKAIEWYHKSLSHQVDYREPLIGIATVYTQKNDHAKAAFWLKAALNIPEPQMPEMVVFKPNYGVVPYDMLAKSQFALGQYADAVDSAEKLYELSPQQEILSDIHRCKEALKQSYKRPDGCVKLNLGCGSKPLEGYINVDLFKQPGVDEVFSLDVIPYADHSVDAINSSHSLEHIPRLRAENALKEWARVMKKGGKLDLKVPDLEECCRLFVENPNYQDSWYMHTLYGVQDFRDTPEAPFEDKVNFGQIHYTGFTENRLRILLTQAGFLIDKMYKYDGYGTPSLAVEAHIPEIPEDQKKRIAFINNTLNPKYFSYGDYWEDAFRASGHQVDTFRYEEVVNLPDIYDIYFFIEANGRYDVKLIPDVFPKIIYVQDSIKEEELDYFDIIATPDMSRLAQWEIKGRSCLFLENSSHIEKVQILLSLKLKKEIFRDTQNLNTLNPHNLPSENQTKELPRSVPAIDIIIPSYKNKQYLELCINSVRKNSNNANIIVVNSGNCGETRNYLHNQHDIVLIDSLDRLSFSQAVNKGLRAASNDVVILNNDTVVGKNWLIPLQNSPYDITNPLSNCDKFWIHELPIYVGGVDLRPNMFLGDVDPGKVMDFSSPYYDTVDRDKPGQSWVAFYATYIKRKVIDATGFLDETFINGGEDYDYCRRAVKKGFHCGHVFSSFVFHYGGKTRKISEEENYQQHHSEDIVNNAYMEFKDRPTVAIYTGQAWEPWSIDSINTTGIGGSETCAAMLAQGFAERGYRSILFGDCDGLEGNKRGVEYVHYTNFDTWKENNHVDYFISSRKMSPLGNKIKNSKNFVWSHDIFIPECINQQPPHAEKVSKFICLSPWHVNFFSDHHKIPKDKIFIQGNGLDLSRYIDRHKVTKDPHRLIYSSSPDRGLFTLLQMFPGWRKEFPQLSLHVFYGFDNWEKAIRHRNNPDEVIHLESIQELMKQPGVYYHGRVSQERLAQEQMRSSIWAYPTLFTETFCITAVECMLAGAVPVCNTVAALQTTVPDGCGVKVDNPWDVSNAVLDLLRHPEKQRALREKGEAHVLNHCGWRRTIQNWITMFETT